MRLGGKLLLIGLPLLALPWLGVRYIGEMRDFVLQGQIQAQRMAAAALGAVLQDHADLLEGGHRAPGASACYVLPLQGHVQLDGYAEDWPRPSARCTTPEAPGRLTLGQRNGRLYLLLRISDATPRYRRPDRAAPGDAVRLAWRDQAGALHQALFSPEGPGAFTVVARSSNEGQAMGANIIDAAWREQSGGYTLEMQLPHARVAAIRLSVTDVDGRPVGEQRRKPAASLTDGWLPLIHPSSAILRILTPLGQRIGHIWVVDSEGWVRAQLGDSDEIRLSDALVRAALRGDPGIERHVRSYAGAEDIRVAQPIMGEHGALGAIILEQDSARIVYLQLAAFQRVVLESLTLILLLIGGLLLFAWRLTWRIRRLGHAADAAIDAAGRVVDAHRVPEGNAGDEIGGLSRNMSRMLERLGRYTRFLERMPRTLRHEINNPLNVITTSLHNYREQVPEAAADAYLQSAERAVRRMDAIVQAMTEAASLEEALRAESRRPMDLAALAAGYADSAGMLHAAYVVAYEGRREDVWILGSDMRIEQLLDKLWDNARDFTPRGGRITFGVHCDADAALLTVDNQGSSIPSRIASSLFDSMVSVRAEASGQRPHLGVGLFVARAIAEFHGGELTAANLADAGGVRFCVRLPLPRGAEEHFHRHGRA